MRIRVRRKQKGGSPLAIAAGRLPLAFSLMGSLARLLGLSRYFRSILLQTGSYTAVGRIQRLPVAASAKIRANDVWPASRASVPAVSMSAGSTSAP